MLQLPETLSSLKNTLLYLGVARCQLTSLGNLEKLTKLLYLDARNNSLTSVSKEIKTMIKETDGFESYFSGNPVCASDTELNCTELCTEYCWSHTGFGNGVCDSTCDSPKCQFDGGDCV